LVLQRLREVLVLDGDTGGDFRDGRFSYLAANKQFSGIADAWRFLNDAEKQTLLALVRQFLQSKEKLS